MSDLLNHKVDRVQDLYNSSEELYNNVVIKGDCSAENMLEDLGNAITNLKTYWHGADAGLNIQKVITIYNSLVEVRNALASLACDSSGVAELYRNIQIANGVNMPEIQRLHYSDKGKIEDYTDNKDTIDISPEAEQGKNNIEAVVNSMDTFITNVNTKYNEIMDNWTQGTGRNNADQAFTEFLNKAAEYKKTLTGVSDTIANALKNYTF
ncbi:MAG: hypothetical protein IKP07_04975 [Bacilli bacterium]|nr:hypothetical protein [Bacilli bacterium]